MVRKREHQATMKLLVYTTIKPRADLKKRPPRPQDQWCEMKRKKTNIFGGV